jgi:uncharacterized protein with ATP-grasp and redox domains
MAKEGDRWAMSGVCPGAIVQYGATPQEAYLNFFETFKKVLQDYSSDATSFEAYHQEVEKFFTQWDAEDKNAFDEARAIIKKTAAVPDPFSELKKETSEASPFLEMARLDLSHTFSFQDNESYIQAVAA